MRHKRTLPKQEIKEDASISPDEDDYPWESCPLIWPEESDDFNGRFDGREFNRDDCECFTFSNANNLPLDALMKRTRRHYGVPWQ